MIRINLIRDRVEHPPAVAERLAPLLPILLLIAYGLTVFLAVSLRDSAVYRATRLQQQVAQEQKIAKEVGVRAVAYKAADLNAITIVREMLSLYSRKWHWAAKLVAVQESLPPGVAITWFDGAIDKALMLRAQAVDADGKGLERIEQTMRNLRKSDAFMHGLEDVQLKSIENPQEVANGGKLYFVLNCPTG